MNGIPETVAINVNGKSREQHTAFFHPLESSGKSIADGVELEGELIKYDETKDEKAEGLEVEGKTDGVAKDERNGELKSKEKIYGTTKGDRGEKYENEDNLVLWLKPLISSLMIELKKQFAANKQGLSLYGAMQRAIGDFWAFFINAVKSLNNLTDLLFSPMLAVFQPPPI
uniref:Uncharacterized protein n=1 Tax=Setaria digitata TaxID=48799 RepID=A0A915PYC9_9BILA